jgi:hypothetical protein
VKVQSIPRRSLPKFIAGCILGVIAVAAPATAQSISEKTMSGFDVIKVLRSGDFTPYYEGNEGDQGISRAYVLDRNDGLELISRTDIFQKETEPGRVENELRIRSRNRGVSEMRLGDKVIAYVIPGDGDYQIYTIGGGYTISILRGGR